MNTEQKQDLLSSIEKFWLEQPDIDLQQPITENEIVRAQEAYHLQLPQPLIDCLKIANGFHEKDKNGFRFWSLAEICPIQEDPLNEYCNFLQFADYLDYSWTYAISCVFPHEVIFVGANSIQKIIATNFYDFLILYLQDHSNLYPRLH
jgi:SMI1 / KNR4 family (SUKH-1)